MLESAAVYRDGSELMAPASAVIGLINAALRLLGVRASGEHDEFDTVGLQRWRHSEDIAYDR